ncbi:hypothetical protein UlMin_002267 [Ulmus minor]
MKRRKTKGNYLALKLDMAKAYDRVEWEFIQKMMNKLGFSDVWIKKIMACISSVTYSFQFNGKRFGNLTPSRGLRQGDPGPTISHLLFADDSLLFLEAKLTACAAIKEILKLYEAASGQVVNLSKSAVCFSPNLSESDAAQMSKLLSAGGKEVLTKSVIQAIPTYTMNLFKLPSSLIKELHRLCAQFCHKADGGMGFRDLRLFNKAILAKQAWRIHSNPTSLAARVLQGFYFQKSSFLQVKVNSSSSFIWRSILWGRELYKQGLRCKIGSGQNTYVYHDCWLPRDGVFKISSPRVLGKFDKVSSLITASGSWDSSLIRNSFHEDEAEAILSLPLPRRSTPDTLLWHYDKSGHYTVRSGYWLANKCRSVPSSSTTSLSSWWKRFWRLRVPSKIRVFIWKAFHNWISSSSNLANHGVPTQKRCVICNEADDTTLHALWGCKALDSLKIKCDSVIQFKLPLQCDLKEFMLSANDGLSQENLEFLCILLWRIWFRRNKWIHERIWLDDESCYSWAQLHHADFLEANCRKRGPSDKVVPSPWQAPQIGFVKVNSDAAWCSNRKKFGLGSVIRDYTGKVLVILESDCLGVTKALETRTLHDSDLSYVFDSIYEICNDFDMYKFSYISRIGNQVAHSLARLALSLENDQIWPSGIPESFIPLVSADLQQVSSS